MTRDKVLEEKLNLLRLELTNLTTKINHTVDNLWKIRTAAFLLWAASVGYSLDPIKSNGQPLAILLLISILIPIWFLLIDAKYNQWYRRLSARERFIQRYINSGSLDELLLKGDLTVQVYDISGEATLANDPDFIWRTSLLRSWTDTTPVVIYGSQMLVSALLSMVYGSFVWLSREWRGAFIPGVLAFYLIMHIVAIYKKWKITLPK